MRLFLRTSLVVLAATVLGATGVWAQGVTLCEAAPDSGGAGCGTPVSIQHPSGCGPGGVDFTGTDFSGGCASTGCASPSVPPVRFWEYNEFDDKNSGTASRTSTGSEWMANPANDFGLPVPDTCWIFFQTNWASPNVEGCIATPRNVAEISFCDGSGPAMYVIGAVEDPALAFFNYDNISDASGASGNLMPLTDVPVPTLVTTMGTDPDMDGFGDIMLTIPGTLPEFSDGSAGALVKGVEILEFTGAAAPPVGCSVGIPAGWNPVLASGGGANLGPVSTGAVTVTVPVPTPLTDRTWFAARVIYVDSSTSCGTGDGCLDPEGQGTPHSCFAEVSVPLTWMIAVKFVDAEALWLGASVQISFRTLLESDTYGFQIQRADLADGDYAVVGSLVARGAGTTYSFEDHTADAGRTYYYKIHEVLVPGGSGAPTVHGPIEIRTTRSVGGARTRDGR